MRRFDATIADRPYRASLSPAEAMRELERCAGSQFDPVVVEAFHETLGEPLAARKWRGRHHWTPERRRTDDTANVVVEDVVLEDVVVEHPAR